MDVTWLGNNAFQISDDLINVLINPSKDLIKNISPPENTVILFTQKEHDEIGSLTFIDSPGENEINNVSVFGVANVIENEENKSICTCYRIESRTLSIDVIGTIGSDFDSQALTTLASPHAVVFSPDNSNIDAEILGNTVRSLEPRKILISGYDKTKSVPSKSLNEIINVFGLKDYEPKSKSSFTISNLGDVQEIIILEN